MKWLMSILYLQFYSMQDLIPNQENSVAERITISTGSFTVYKSVVEYMKGSKFFLRERHNPKKCSTMALFINISV